MPEPSPVPIDEAEPPDWAMSHFSPAQGKELSRSLLWLLLVYEARGLGLPAVSIAQRIYVAVHTKKKHEPKKMWLSVRTLSVELDMGSTNTVTAAFHALEADGWVVSRPRPNNGKDYFPAWPGYDCLAPSSGPERCGAPTKKGVCTKRAGWGTGGGTGHCKLHRDGQVSQEMRHLADAEPVDNDPDGLPGVSLDATPGVSPNEAVSQEMRHGVAAGETEYVSVTSDEFDQMSKTRVPPLMAEVEVPPVRSESDEDRIIDVGEVRPQPVRSNAAPDVEPKHLAPLPDLCVHGEPGGYLPGPKRSPDEKFSPRCQPCRGHINSGLCRDPTHCPKCIAIMQAAGVEPEARRTA